MSDQNQFKDHLSAQNFLWAQTNLSHSLGPSRPKLDPLPPTSSLLAPRPRRAQRHTTPAPLLALLCRNVAHGPSFGNAHNQAVFTARIQALSVPAGTRIRIEIVVAQSMAAAPAVLPSIPINSVTRAATFYYLAFATPKLPPPLELRRRRNEVVFPEAGRRAATLFHCLGESPSKSAAPCCVPPLK